MSEDFEPDEILALLNEDRELYELLVESGLLSPGADRFSAEDAELARVTGTLIHELEVNWAGTEVILRMRTELVATRRQIAVLVRRLKDQT
ncbi:MAG: hypothetical protein ACI9KE_004027 [Polyangiales bacterium]|jgi:hypothetical protein